MNPLQIAVPCGFFVVGLVLVFFRCLRKAEAAAYARGFAKGRAGQVPIGKVRITRRTDKRKYRGHVRRLECLRIYEHVDHGVDDFGAEVSEEVFDQVENGTYEVLLRPAKPEGGGA